MKKVKLDLVAWTVGLYVLLPMFFRIGPVSAYSLVILAVCGFTMLWQKIRIPAYALTNVGWDARFLLIMIPMVHHNEYTAIVLYLIAPVLLYLLLIHDIRSEDRLNRILDVLIWCSAINALVCFVEVLTGFNLSYALCNDGTATYVPLYRYGILRVYGCFVNPINNGVYAMMMSAVVLYRIYSGKLLRQKRLVLWVIWFANLAVVILTSSRAAMLAAAVVNVVLLWQVGAFRLSARFLLFCTTALAAVVLLLLIPNPLTKQLQEMLLSVLQIIDDIFGTGFVESSGTDEIVEGVGNRLELYDWVRESVGSDTLFGKGRAAKFEYVMNQFGHTKKSIENQYLSEYFRYGMVGLCSKIFLFATLLISKFLGMVRERKAGVKLGFSSVLFAVLLAYFLCLFTVAQNQEEKLFYLLVVLGEIYTRSRFYLKKKEVQP
ncbi:MAG: hypothetical protein IJB17_02480 [Oscillospiraceae bacterium]|nr:hypothetical protein [Oscillospiraceae bacterium]